MKTRGFYGECAKSLPPFLPNLCPQTEITLSKNRILIVAVMNEARAVLRLVFQCPPKLLIFIIGDHLPCSVDFQRARET